MNIPDGPAATKAPVHGLRHGEFIVLMSLVTATIAISIDTVLPAFDEIETEFGLNTTDSPISLTITVFLIAMGFATLVWGPLADRFGRKSMLWTSLALFIVGAAISTFATSFGMFLFGRVVWGAAAAGPRTVSLAVTRDSYDGDLMARIMSLTTAVFLVVPVLAPAVGEAVISIGSWRWTTAVAIVLGVIAAAWIGRMDETLDPADVLPLEFGRVVRAAKVVATTRSTMWFTLATTFAYGAFFPWLGSSTTMLGDIYGRSDTFALWFGANAIFMAIAILLVERSLTRLSTMPVLIALSIAGVVVAAAYVIWAIGADGVFSFWPWFLLASLLTALNAGSTPLMQTLSMEPMGKIAGTASSVTGAVVFIGGALLGSFIDSAIDTTVTPFGVGFLLYGGIALVFLLLGQRSARG